MRVKEWTVNDMWLAEQLRWWAAECDRTNFGCQARGALLEAAEVLEKSAPVVRCKDCKHYVDRKEISKKCCYVHLLTPHPMPEDGFCSYGERKDGDV